MMYRDFLKKAEAFKKLDDNQLNALEACCEEVIFNRGERLFAEGDPSHHVWILVDGNVDLRNEPKEEPEASLPKKVHFVSETDLFGWSCFVPPYHYYLSGYCNSVMCRVLRIKREDAVRLFEKDMHMGYIIMSYILRVVGTHFQQFQDELGNN